MENWNANVLVNAGKFDADVCFTGDAGGFRYTLVTLSLGRDTPSAHLELMDTDVLYLLETLTAVTRHSLYHLADDQSERMPKEYFAFLPRVLKELAFIGQLRDELGVGEATESRPNSFDEWCKMRRSRRVGAALAAYGMDNLCPPEVAMIALLTDLQHHCALRSENFDAAVELSRTHFEAELDEAL